jgi:NADP-dependent 3-hydroxy acid dehydrogenase YdfG
MAKVLDGTVALVIRSLKRDRRSDIADAVSYIVTRPRHVAVNEMLIRPTEQER